MKILIRNANLSESNNVKILFSKLAWIFQRRKLNELAFLMLRILQKVLHTIALEFYMADQNQLEHLNDTRMGK